MPLLHAEAGRAPQRVGLAHPSIAPYGVFTTGDGKPILISIQSEREWRSFCGTVLGDAALASDPRFSSNVLRVRHRAQTDALVAAAFARMDERAATEALMRSDVAFASVNDMAALSAHPHLRRITVPTPAGPVSFPAPAPIIEGQERAYGPVPAIDAHGPLDQLDRKAP